jgi:hypothetical protein
VVNKLAERGELPDVSRANGVLKMTPLSNMEPPEAEALARQTSAMLPRIKITALMEVDGWTGFSRHCYRHGPHGIARNRVRSTESLPDAPFCDNLRSVPPDTRPVLGSVRYQAPKLSREMTHEYEALG